MKRTKLKKAVEFTKKLLPKKVGILVDKIPLGCYNATIGGGVYMTKDKNAIRVISDTQLKGFNDVLINVTDNIERAYEASCVKKTKATETLSEIMMSEKPIDESKIELARINLEQSKVDLVQSKQIQKTIVVTELIFAATIVLLFGINTYKHISYKTA